MEPGSGLLCMSALLLTYTFTFQSFLFYLEIAVLLGHLMFLAPINLNLKYWSHLDFSIMVLLEDSSFPCDWE